MKYTKPSIQPNEAQAAQMLAESLKLSDTPVDGSEALTKKNDDWNIWNED